jgi:hypothetical protein
MLHDLTQKLATNATDVVTIALNVLHVVHFPGAPDAHLKPQTADVLAPQLTKTQRDSLPRLHVFLTNTPKNTSHRPARLPQSEPKP